MTLEVLHDVEESVINVGLVVKLNFDLVQVGQSILCGRDS